MAAEPRLGVHVKARHPHREVQQRIAVGQPGGAQQVTPSHPGALLDRRSLEEGNTGLEAPAVVDTDREHPGHLPGEADHPAIGPKHRSTGGDREVHPPVTGESSLRGEGRNDRTFHRRGETDAGDHPELSE